MDTVNAPLETSLAEVPNLHRQLVAHGMGFPDDFLQLDEGQPLIEQISTLSLEQRMALFAKAIFRLESVVNALEPRARYIESDEFQSNEVERLGDDSDYVKKCLVFLGVWTEAKKTLDNARENQNDPIPFVIGAGRHYIGYLMTSGLSHPTDVIRKPENSGVADKIIERMPVAKWLLGMPDAAVPTEGAYAKEKVKDQIDWPTVIRCYECYRALLKATENAYPLSPIFRNSQS